MKVLILDKELEFKNDEREIELIFQEIDQIIINSNHVLSYLNIDGVEVYEDFYEYFFKNIEGIREVKINTITTNQLAQNVLSSTSDYLARAIPEIEKLSNEFYKTPEQESWNKLADLFEGIKWIIDTFSNIDQNYKLEKIVKDYKTWNLYANDLFSLGELLGEFEDALISKDYILVADILSYEITPLFKEMFSKLIILVGMEATSYVVN